MLGKLIKHEFRATGRLMAPLFGAMLLLAVFVRVSDLILSAADVPVFFEALNSLLLIVYVLAILSVTVFSTVLMIKRFHQNFLTDEGYLMFTLPTSVHSLLWSKLITAALFFIFTFLADALAVAIVVWRGGTARDLFESIVGLFRELNSFYMANGIALALEILALEILALLLVSLLVTCLLFYAPMSIGYSFANHKGLLSVVFYFVIQAILQIFGVAVLSGVVSDTAFHRLLTDAMDNLGRTDTAAAAMQAAHGTMLLALFTELFLGVLLYFLTYVMLRKHRNLQ